MNKKIKEMLECGFDVNYNRVSIARVHGQIDRYQVFSDDYRYPFTAVYDEEDLDIAVDKFMLVINQIRSKHDTKSKTKIESV